MKSRFFAVRMISCVAMVGAFAAPGRAADVPGRIEVVDRPGQLVIRVDKHELATYVYEDPHIPRPYFKDVHAPGGIQVTRNHPPREGVDPTDHAAYHPGLWLAFGDLGGADFWRNKAVVKHVEFVQRPVSKGRQARFAVRNAYMDGDAKVCEEVSEYTFVVRPTGILILWDSQFASKDTSFYFGDQEEMGLGLRVATPIAVKSESGGRILDSEGRKNEKATWGKIAAWCDYSGWVDKTFAGVTIMPHPDNVRPCWWHTRDYGFMTANLFGRAAFGAGAASRIEVTAGQRFHLRFGILLHAGATEDAVDLHTAYKDYLRVLNRVEGSTAKGGQK